MTMIGVRSATTLPRTVVLKKLYLVVRPDGELVMITKKGEAKSYAKHYKAKLYHFRWSAIDQQYGIAERMR